MDVEWKEDLSLSRFHNLQKLALGVKLPVNVFQKLIKSITDASKLKSLQLNLEGLAGEECKSEIGEFLCRCLSLEELNIEDGGDMYPDKNLNIKLKKLRINQLANSKELVKIGSFIQQQKESLESLDLHLHVFFSQFQLVGFLEELKSLKRLKKLKLKLDIFAINMQSSLNELIGGLECLEELDLAGTPVDFKESSFEDFCKALDKRNLRSLKLFFNDYCLSKKDSDLFNRVLEKFGQLEHLELQRFEIEDPGFYTRLRDIVCFKNQRLNEVILENVKRGRTKEYCKNLIRMLKDIIHKSTMKKFSYGEMTGCGFPDDFNGVELESDVKKEAHHFDDLSLPAYIQRVRFF